MGLALYASTELLSLIGALRRWWIALFWLSALAGGISTTQFSGFRVRKPNWDPVVLFCCAAIGAIVTLTGLAAAFSPPNSSDAMAYHLPRVIYWAEQASVRFFPTPYLNQIMLQPMAEYAMLHLYLLSGTDGLTNFVQWLSAFGSIVGVSAVAHQFGANARGQAVAALFSATLPAGILAASGAKNDWMLAFWLIAAVYFAHRFASERQPSDAIFLGIALGSALLTKATAYLFLPPLLIAIFFAGRCFRPSVFKPSALALTLGLALLINAPQYLRNYDLSGSILGFDSAQGDGFFRWRNETFGWKQTVSNLLRHVSEQLGARSKRWNYDVYQTVVAVHEQLGIDVNDPATTWRWSEYHPPKNSNHEADAPNRWHLTALLALACIFFWRAARGRSVPQALYAAALFLGFLLFCFYLKWQPFMGRLLVPLFVAAAPLAGIVGDLKFSNPLLTAALQLALCLLLLDGARHPLEENWVRPLTGAKSVLHTSRRDQYFADLQPWHNQASYEKTVDLLTASVCRPFGLDITNLQLEYPLIALLREKMPEAKFVHSGVENASKKYRQPVEEKPCAVVCLDCNGDARRMATYSGFPGAVPVDRFMVYSQVVK